LGLLVGIDRSVTALKFAADASGPPRKDDGHAPLWIAGDALRLPLADRSVEVAVCSLFLHHLEQPQIVTILQEAARVARRAVVVGELVRSWPAWIATYIATRVLSRSWIFHADGPRSVRAAFRARELRELAATAGLLGAQVRRVFPFRYIMTWQRPR
jgi:ubiquinone/menaquinone biosynthesis C-methylase UbiE